MKGGGREVGRENEGEKKENRREEGRMRGVGREDGGKNEGGREREMREG